MANSLQHILLFSTPIPCVLANSWSWSLQLPISATHTMLYGCPAMRDRSHPPDLQVRMPTQHCGDSRLLLPSIARSIPLSFSCM
ncbi:hypothetical protein BJ912DRAFT_1000016 [Pholiota molesta]|nr:hypothetical protein BJ912DRAFT_1000016 [Pholiota molesta]